MNSKPERLMASINIARSGGITGGNRKH